MEHIYSGRMICKSCKREITWFCVNHKRRSKDENVTIISMPAGTQMVHTCEYVDEAPVFEGQCHLCGSNLKLPAKLALEVPEEFRMA